MVASRWLAGIAQLAIDQDATPSMLDLTALCAELKNNEPKISPTSVVRSSFDDLLNAALMAPPVRTPNGV